MLLALAIVLLIIAIAGGVIIHPVIFVLALIALDDVLLGAPRGPDLTSPAGLLALHARRVVRRHGRPDA
jgi:hypothetical protein